MLIEASHWAKICCAVEEHAKKLHPVNKEKQRELIEELLCITSRETMLRRSAQADAAVQRMNKPSLVNRLKSLFG